MEADNEIFKLKEEFKLAELARDKWHEAYIGCVNQLAKQVDDTLLLKKALEDIAKPTYGTELCNTDEDNNEILARHFFDHQNIARKTLKELNYEC